MLEEQGLVVDVDDQGIWVETCRQSACQSCSAKSSCGHSLLGKISKGKTQRFLVRTELTLQAGDQVVLGLGEGAFLRGSALLYLLPLLSMMFFTLVGEQLIGQESNLSLLMAVIGLGLGFAYVRWYSQKHRNNPDYQPVVLRQLPTPVSAGGSDLIARSNSGHSR